MIINSVNGKVYVGQSKNPDERKKCIGILLTKIASTIFTIPCIVMDLKIFLSIS